MHDLNNFYTNGFCIIDNFLKGDVSDSLLNKFKTIKNWDRVDQVRNHYQKGGPFEMESIYFPNHDEEYYLQGWRAKDYESSELWAKYFNDKFLTKISELFQKKNSKRYNIYFKIYKK